MHQKVVHFKTSCSAKLANFNLLSQHNWRRIQRDWLLPHCLKENSECWFSKVMSSFCKKQSKWVSTIYVTTFLISQEFWQVRNSFNEKATRSLCPLKPLFLNRILLSGHNWPSDTLVWRCSALKYLSTSIIWERKWPFLDEKNHMIRAKNEIRSLMHNSQLLCW